MVLCNTDDANLALINDVLSIRSGVRMIDIQVIIIRTAICLHNTCVCSNISYDVWQAQKQRVWLPGNAINWGHSLTYDPNGFQSPNAGKYICESLSGCGPRRKPKIDRIKLYRVLAFNVSKPLLMNDHAHTIERHSLHHTPDSIAVAIRTVCCHSCRLRYVTHLEWCRDTLKFRLHCISVISHLRKCW